jgi:signal transduction histidine kinase
MPSRRRDRERWSIAAGVLLAWAGILVVLGLWGLPGAKVKLFGEIAARYGLALPGGLLGAWGLRHETYRTIEPDRLPLVKPSMRLTELALVAFAVTAGSIGPHASFFPASLVNEDVLLVRFGIPVSLLRGLAGTGLTLGVVRALSVVLKEIEMWLESVEQMQALVAERERIGRELHDGIIQSIYASGLILEGARQSVGENPEEARGQLTVAIDNLNDTIQNVRRYIFDLRGEMPQESLETALRKLLKEFHVNTMLETEFKVKGEAVRRLDAERRRHVLQIAREALMNAARHAYAERVILDLTYDSNALRLSVADDGVGLSSIPSGNGHGLRNIRERARLVNGRLRIDTAPGEGLRMVLIVPYQQRMMTRGRATSE